MLNSIRIEQAKLKAYTNEELVNMLLRGNINERDKYLALIKELKLRDVEL